MSTGSAISQLWQPRACPLTFPENTRTIFRAGRPKNTTNRPQGFLSRQYVEIRTPFRYFHKTPISLENKDGFSSPLHLRANPTRPSSRNETVPSSGNPISAGIGQNRSTPMSRAFLRQASPKLGRKMRYHNSHPKARRALASFFLEASRISIKHGRRATQIELTQEILRFHAVALEHHAGKNLVAGQRAATREG